MEDVGIMYLPGIWEDCKTKKQREAFRKELERIDKEETFLPFDELEKEFKKNPKKIHKFRRRKF